MRWLCSLLIAVLIVLASFVLMLVMIFPPKNKTAEPALQVGHFVPKMQQESSDPSRSRQKMPEQPQQPPAETPPAQQAPQPPSTPQAASLDLAVPQLPSDINIAAAATPSLQGLTAQAVTPAAPSAPATPAAPVAVAPSETSAQSAQSSQSTPSPSSTDADVIPLNEVLPVYPDSARRRGIEGYVQLAFTITAEGKVENVRVIDSSPARVFDREARRAALRWRFAPRTENGQLVAREAVKKLEFRLEKRGR